jgi:thiol-disulfide isomerase/thioredoxin
MRTQSQWAAGVLALLGVLAMPAASAHAENRAAPDFVGITQWLNSGPLHMRDLRGKVVLVDFWTYGCVNCVNTCRMSRGCRRNTAVVAW